MSDFQLCDGPFQSSSSVGDACDLVALCDARSCSGVSGQNVSGNEGHRC